MMASDLNQHLTKGDVHGMFTNLLQCILLDAVTTLSFTVIRQFSLRRNGQVTQYFFPVTPTHFYVFNSPAVQFVLYHS